jgi:nitrite reductase/ring-hydroxylating ferredoxin subunit
MSAAPHDAAPPETGACPACALADGRRRFLRDAFLIAAGTLMALGLSREDAEARPLALIRAHARTGDTLTYPIPAADGVQLDRDNQVILVRWQGDAYAFNLACPHQNTALRWDGADQRFQCPKHHSKYQPDGTFISGRATRNMDRFAITRAGPNLVVNVDAMYRQDKEPAAWTAAFVKLT